MFAFSFEVVKLRKLLTNPLARNSGSIIDGATTYGNQAAASSISFALSSHFIGVIPQGYSKDPRNRAAVGRHTVTGRDPSTGSTTTRTTTNMVRIANSGTIEEE